MPTWLEITLRTLAAVVSLYFLTKLLGKRQVSQLSVFEYITGITIGSLAAYIGLEQDPRWYWGILSLAVWVAVSYAIEWIQIKSKKGRDFIDGSTQVLIKSGRIMEENLMKEKITSDELMEGLRKKSVFRVADVEFAVIEPSGEINVQLKKEHQPLTANDLGIIMQHERSPQILIMDGEVMNEQLRGEGLDEHWLKKELAKLGVKVEDVFLAQVDANKQLYVDLYDDKRTLNNQYQPTANVLLQLRQIEASLKTSTEASKDEKAIQLHQLVERFRQDLEQVMEDPLPPLKQ
ncbi:DUF421 domain-containing protein [Paenibacillus sp. 1001270B_150601_E10]|uniref:DUF421 domain-containing protein n=1 Tax=Paenibacillus sp. 1001270B_150601_E10 TaxID=2787079 RepID=UPI0018A03BFF|nr:DUF421 domain-containing protein [Paenibacillus sp. 1001270B_150601_E10]